MTFSLRARHQGRTSWLTAGDAIALEFDDGKGVSGRIADVSVAPGGLPFSIIVTADGVPISPLFDGLTGERIDDTQSPIPQLVDLETGFVADPDHELKSWKEAHGRVREILEKERLAHQKVTDELNVRISELQSTRSRTTVQAGAVTITVEEN